MSGNGTVIIAGNFSFPTGNAAGKRVLGIGYVLRNLGYEVVFAGCDIERNENNIIKTKKEYNGFCCYNFIGTRNIKNILNVKKAYEEFKKIIRDVGEERIVLVILYGSPVLGSWIGKIIRLCKHKRINIVFDCVDWIEKSGFESTIKNVMKYLDTNYTKRFLACKCDGIICVSSYLDEYYKKKGKKTIVIPPVGVVDNDFKSYNTGVESSYSVNDRIIKIVYAGSIPIHQSINPNELKDRIDKTIELINCLHNDGLNIVLDIYGIEQEKYIAAFPNQKVLIESLDGIVNFWGKVSNQVVCEKIKKSNFTILNRDITKVTTAGFPSKISESLCLGTPVITNKISDIDNYIIDGENGILIESSLAEAKKHIMQYFSQIEMIDKMKCNCKEDCVFDYKKYVSPMQAFLKTLNVKVQ